MDDIGWGLDPWGMQAWGSLFEGIPGGGEIEIEKVDGVVVSPGVFTFEQG